MESPEKLREQAERYRRLIFSTADYRTIEALRELAAEYEAMALKLDAAPNPKQLSDAYRQW